MTVCAGLLLVQLVTPSWAAGVGRLRAPTQVGTVDTVAGPGFCPEPAEPAPGSGRVGALAVDDAGPGTIWFESGPTAERLITSVFSNASVVVNRAGVAPTSGPARLASAARLAPDRGGGVLIAGPRGIQQFSGGLGTLAGTASDSDDGANGAGGGDGGAFARATFTSIEAITTDHAGNVFVADEIDGESGAIAIRFLNRSDKPVTFHGGTRRERTVAPGSIDTVVGGSAEEGAQPPERLVGAAPALAVSGDRLYVAAAQPRSRATASILVVNLGSSTLFAHGATVPAGETATVASADAGGEGAPASAVVPPIPGITADEEGNLFFVEHGLHRVRRLDSEGRLTVFAGTGVAGFNGNDRPAVEARLDGPYDVDVGAGGRVYISDAGNAQARFVDQAGTIRPTLGNGTGIRWVCGDPDRPQASGSRFGRPVNLAADAAGNAYVVTNALGQVQRLTPSGSLRPVVGRPPAAASCRDPFGCPVADGTPAATAELAEVAAVAVRDAGGIYVQDLAGIRFVNLGPRPVTAHGAVVAPGAMHELTKSFAPDIQVPEDSELAPFYRAISRYSAAGRGALATDTRGNLLVGDGPNGTVRQVDPDGNVTTLVEKRPADAPAGSACCGYLSGLATDPDGNLYVADLPSRRVWFLNRGTVPVTVHGVQVAPGALTAVAGSADAGTLDEGAPALDAQLTGPGALALDRSGNLYVLNGSDHTIRRVDSTGVITTVVGTGQQGFNGDGLKGPLTALERPTHLSIDACGNLLIADTGNDRVRRLNLVRSCAALLADDPVTGGSSSLFPTVAAAAGAVALAAGLVSRRRHRADPTGRLT